MRKRFLYGAVFLMSHTNAFAAGSVEQDVEYLLSEISASNCEFIRNGSRYSADEAVEHMRMKYDYAKDDIETVDDFIKKVGSRSSFSGRTYMIECPSQNVTETGPWLRNIWITRK